MARSNSQIWDDVAAAYERETLIEAAHETQQEIADYAGVGRDSYHWQRTAERDARDEGDDEPEYDDLEELEAMEGADGEPMTMDDLMEGPDPETGYDRPAALRADRDLMRQNQELRDRIAQVEQQYHTEFEAQAPERRAAMEAHVREQLYQTYGVLPTNDEGANRLIADLVAQQQQIHALNEDRINGSMSRAHERYGDEFSRAFESLGRASRSGDRTAQAIVRDVMGHSDPGERLVEIGFNLEAGRSRRNSDAFTERYGAMDARASPSRGGGRRGRDDGDGYDGSSSEAIEREIFESAFR